MYRSFNILVDRATEFGFPIPTKTLLPRVPVGPISTNSSITSGPDKTVKSSFYLDFKILK